mmetsp:Transcript_46721/g.111118  ORF Transcript_46721/g.111118 Transcript_46721/m.111118 type:complete len:497 (-) Transcript_46721:65-1555(-)
MGSTGVLILFGIIGCLTSNASARRNPVQFVKLSDVDGRDERESEWRMEPRRPLVHKARRMDRSTNLANAEEGHTTKGLPRHAEAEVLNSSNHGALFHHDGSLPLEASDDDITILQSAAMQFPSAAEVEEAAVKEIAEFAREPLRAWETAEGMLAEPEAILVEPPAPTGERVVLLSQVDSRHKGALAKLTAAHFFGFLFMFCALVTCLLMSMLWAMRSHQQSSRSDVSEELSHVTRQYIETLPVQAPGALEGLFRARAGGDCLLFQPQISTAVVRLEGWVWAAEEARMMAPLSGKVCVYFNAMASEVTSLDVASAAAPLATCTGANDFFLELHSPGNEVCCRVAGADVALFDTTVGRYRQRTQADRSQDRLKEFMRLHSLPRSQPIASSTMLDFTENRLELGALVTCVGELRRSPSGDLRLGPLRGPRRAAAAEPVEAGSIRAGLTSWEQQGLDDFEVGSGNNKVMISDDPGLLRTGALFALLQFGGCGRDRRDIAG